MNELLRKSRIDGYDEAIHSVADLAFPVTSNADEVKRFLSGTGNRVVFSTYQSSSVIAAAQADATIPAFDLAVADEAHRCAGKVGSDFTTILDNTQIRSTKRLFATATPRTYSSTVHKAAEDRGVEVVGMDNVAQFGVVLYALPFGKAIERKLLTDYRVVIIGVDDPTIAQWIENRELVSLSLQALYPIAPSLRSPPQRGKGQSIPLPLGEGLGEGCPLGEGRGEGAFHDQKNQPSQIRETDSESLAAQIGLLKAIKDYDLKRIISFHSRVKRAEAFTTDMQNTMQWISDEHRPSGTLRTDFVSGNMSANKRKIKLDQLKALSADERGVLSNARCLSEGVDVPSLDGVAFIDPRSSQVDIIQAVGRAIRLSPDKKAGTIVLPVFIKAGEDAASTIEASNFKPIWEVLDALKAHDDVLADELDQIRTEMGRKSGSAFNASDLNKISIDLPATVDANFSNALRTYLVEQVTSSWDERFGELLAYSAKYGNPDVPQAWATGLGTWVINQRAAKKGRRQFLSESQIRRLDEIGFNWDSLESQWEKRFNELLAYKAKYGDMNVPAKSSSGLGMWVGMQRAFKKRGSIPDDRYSRLNEIGFAWDGVESIWEERFGELLAYKEINGDVNVPNDRGSKLWRWISTQRIFRKKGKLSTEKIQRLDALGFTWDMLDSQWDSKISELLAYKDKFGNVNVSKQRSASLSGWVQAQRGRKNQGSLSEERIRQLNEIGFDWNPFASQWETKFCELLAYWERHGNTNVPINWPDGLNAWAKSQRADKRDGKLSDERIRQLEEIGFVWNPHAALWEAGFCELLSYKAEHGHVNVPHSVTGLGAWVGSQRSAKKKGKISVERVQRLEEIGFEWERNNKHK